MFGHVDAGVLHVRPAIDLKDPEQERLIREVTEEVVAITQQARRPALGRARQGRALGVLAGFFGPLYPTLQAIKAAFDPGNQLNPGKIAAPAEGRLLTVDGVPTKGQFDRTIPPEVRAGFDEALHCNGNGACYNWDPDDPMCPSWKGMRERRHSPKGRAQLIRDWLRQLAALGFDPIEGSRRLRRTAGWRALPTRLSATLGPTPRRTRLLARGQGSPGRLSGVQVLHRPVSDQGGRAQLPLEVLRALLRALPSPVQGLRGRLDRASRPRPGADAWHGQHAYWRRAGAGDPANGRARRYASAIGREHRAAIAARGVELATSRALTGTEAEIERARSVVIVQDAFTSYYETPRSSSIFSTCAGARVPARLAPFRPNGKALHVHGFLGLRAALPPTNAAMLQDLAATGVELVGLDPSMTLTYRSEYAGALDASRLPKVLLVQEWLAQHRDALPGGRRRAYRLLPHCTERTMALAAVRDWSTVFAAFGLRLTILPSGCCGMAGTWGHEAEHHATSKHIYSLSWAQ